MTLEQVKATRPTMDFDGRYGPIQVHGPPQCSSKLFIRVSRRRNNAQNISISDVAALLLTAVAAYGIIRMPRRMTTARK